jgi:glutathione synthase/RimK-type ligase-like ATP-grasp enzyme
MSSIGVFFNDPEFEGYPFDDNGYKAAYTHLASVLERKGCTMYIVRGMSAYVSGNTFSRGWRFAQGQFQEVTAPFTVNLIYNKGSKFVPTADASVLNKREMDIICRDKMRSYALFADLFPRTLLADDAPAAQEALASMGTPTVVLKPSDGWGGSKIWIGPKEDAMEHVQPFPVMIQEFIDTSAGIPGYPNLKHDFRMIIMNGHPLFTFLRVPKEGSLVSNVGKGGRVIVVPAEQRPQGALSLIPQIDAKFERFGNRMYSIDCGLDRSGTWKLIELNDQPGLMTSQECGQYADSYFEDLTEFLLECIAHPTKGEAFTVHASSTPLQSPA